MLIMFFILASTTFFSAYYNGLSGHGYQITISLDSYHEQHIEFVYMLLSVLICIYALIIFVFIVFKTIFDDEFKDKEIQYHRKLLEDYENEMV